MLRPFIPSIIAARYYFYHKKLGPLLNKLGVIPKNLYDADVNAVRACFRVRNAGGVICVFPEGRLSAYGSMETITAPTLRFLKKLGLPVLNIHIEGSYLTTPKFDHTVRRGRIDVTAEQVFSAEDWQTLPLEELEKRLYAVLDYDEFKTQAEKRVRFKSRARTKNLEHLLYICPRCGAEFSMATYDDKIRCTACGNGAVLNEYYDFVPFGPGCVVPANIRDWYLLQKEKEYQAVRENDAYELRSHVLLKQPRGGKEWFSVVGEGETVLDRNGLRYEGTKDGEAFCFTIPLSIVPVLLYGTNENYESYYNGEFYYFLPNEPQHSVKWSVVYEQIHRLYEEGVSNGE